METPVYCRRFAQEAIGGLGRPHHATSLSAEKRGEICLDINYSDTAYLELVNSVWEAGCEVGCREYALFGSVSFGRASNS